MFSSDAIQCRKLILVGKSGNGKSSTGNTILGEQVFEHDKSPGSVTQKCWMHSRFIGGKIDREISVVDTPGLFDTDIPFAERALEIQRALEYCPNPHAFLIIMRADVRYTEEEKLTIDILRVIFGEEFLKHAILVFTRGSEFSSNVQFDSFLEKNESINNLKNECKGRVVLIENNPSVDNDIRKKLTHIFYEMVEQVSNDGKHYYQYKSLSVHREILIRHIMYSKPDAQLRDELDQLIKELGEQLKNKESWRPYILGGLVGATAGMATFGGAAYFAPFALVGNAAATGTGARIMGTAIGYAGPVIRGGASMLGNAASTLGRLAVLSRFK